MTILGDFHMHSQFCPHGSDDTMEQYVQKAIEQGLQAVSFTEHAPLPLEFTDPAPTNDSVMNWHDVDVYLKEGNRLKQKYKQNIVVHIGFEVDYLLGFEKETEKVLNQLGSNIDDAILSVHMLKAPNDTYVCLDYSANEFGRIVDLFGSIDRVYDAYFNTLKAAIASDLGAYKPKRIGHISLIDKFHKQFHPVRHIEPVLEEILDLMKQKHYSLDVNTAGFYKEWCGVSYPAPEVITLAAEKGIPLVPGSDSHLAEHVGRGFDRLPSDLLFSLPTRS
ncbi:histidinol-phosphatase HisJ [Aquibacillus sp. 3ASR75-11]|uniref:Histidinol-phosphatase n=1 Tax=Terrihalobacillus insolitus TaxID=2950438 RepID=A0A9X3WWL9_9BACI|nr:histidinol-phosphatase HisJ [Terrihalobacillus insolitus]MDC3425898.1 histidinol-phosphatase HisJ [Terrihalobacillus insolitus]